KLGADAVPRAVTVGGDAGEEALRSEHARGYCPSMSRPGQPVSTSTRWRSIARASSCSTSIPTSRSSTPATRYLSPSHSITTRRDPSRHASTRESPHTAARSDRGRSHTRPPKRHRRRGQRAAARGSFGVFERLALSAAVRKEPRSDLVVASALKRMFVAGEQADHHLHPQKQTAAPHLAHP